MACNRIRINAVPEVVFAHLSDAALYPRWVVGAQAVRHADRDWPLAESFFRPQVGLGPLGAAAETRAVDLQPTRRLTLVARLALGTAEIAIDVEPCDEGSVVTLREEIRRPRPLGRFVEPFLHARNAESLRRLKALIEGSKGGIDVIAGVEALRTVDPWFDRPGYREVVRSARRCCVAVSTRGGPHVTPVTFAIIAGRMWVVMDRESVKARALERRPEVGILVTRGESSVVVAGRAHVLDPWRPWEWPAQFVDAALAVPALLDYTRRNALRIGRYVGLDPLSILKLRPSARVLVAVTPVRTALIGGGRILDRRGEWSEPEAAPAVPGEGDEDFPRQEVPAALPEDIRALLGKERAPVAVGFDATDGVIALPGRWDPGRGAATVSLDVLELAGDVGEHASICLYSEEGGELRQKKGIVLRGERRLFATDDVAVVGVDGGRASYWAGARTGTVRAEDRMAESEQGARGAPSASSRGDPR